VGVHSPGAGVAAGAHQHAESMLLHDPLPALRAFYTAMGGMAWKNSSGWLSDHPPCYLRGRSGNCGGRNLEDLPCKWRGLRCRDGQPIFLGLGSNALSGSLPTEIGMLSSLEEMHFHFNRISGSIPTEIGQLSLLNTLHLHDNLISGSIPSQLGRLSATMEWLDPNENSLSGSVPTELWHFSRLKEFHCGTNRLSGSIPPEVGQLSSLVHFDVEHNRFSGSIPSHMAQLQSVTELRLYDNVLSGSIPVQLANMTRVDFCQLAAILDTNQFACPLSPGVSPWATAHGCFEVGDLYCSAMPPQNSSSALPGGPPPSLPPPPRPVPRPTSWIDHGSAATILGLMLGLGVAIVAALIRSLVRRRGAHHPTGHGVHHHKIARDDDHKEGSTMVE
jgi:hypothetical protein